MSFAPTIPPLPQDFNNPQQRRQDSKPPIPPLPPNFHPEQPLAAPTPERILPTLPADMARTLDENINYGGVPSRASSLYPSSPYPGDPFRRSSPAPPPPGAYPGGFSRPTNAYGAGPPPRTGPSPSPYGSPGPAFPSAPGYPSVNGPGYPNPGGPPYHSPPPVHGPYASPPPAQGSYMASPPAQHPYSLNGAMAGMSVNPPPRNSSAQPQPYVYSHSPPVPHAAPQYQPQPSPTATRGSSAPELTAPIPTLDSLTSAQRVLPSRPSPEHVPWIRDVILLVDRVVAQQSQSQSPPEGPVSITDPTLRRMAVEAITMLLALFSSPPAQLLPPHMAEACYLRGTLYSSGAFPDLVQRSPREAFRDFETAARAGFQKAWFKLGRDYEAVGDLNRARDCFERGVRGGIESCFYRMGMARLLGQLSLPASPSEALPLLHRAATLASIEVPQPAYVYGLLLLGEFTHVRVEERMFASLIPAGSTPLLEARKFVERAAYLGFAPAQYKLGHAYEYAVPPFPFDPLLSVQYYSSASQQGEPEADMALSKWFLCGAEGAFEKDEALALTFAEKAAHKGLGSAEFAMGYYAEVGVGGHKDMDAARKWYAKAVEHGNADAPERLKALSQPSPQALSRTEHDQITDAKLVRKHTQAKMSAAAAGRHAQTLAAAQAGQGAGASDVVGRIQAHAARPSLSSPPPQAYVPTPPPSGPPPAHAPALHGRGYSLSDTPGPAPDPGTPPNAAPPAGGRAAGRPPGRRTESTHPPVQSPALPPPSSTPPPPRKSQGSSPATFAEMGFQSGKAEDKDCVIM